MRTGSFKTRPLSRVISLSSSRFKMVNIPPAVVSVFDKLSLPAGVKLIAVVNLIWSLILIALESLLLCTKGLDRIDDWDGYNPDFIDQNELRHLFHIGSADSGKHSTWNVAHVQVIALSFVWMAAWLLDFCFSVLLYEGGRIKSTRLCTIWFCFRCSALAFRILFLAVYLLAGYTMVTKVPVVGRIIFSIYSLWIVNRFINQLHAARVASESSPATATHKQCASNVN